jgi:prepilin-type N-terminal cleavage/methylation domain-containing protein
MPRRAFSLLEVLIAIAVVAAIAGVVFANLSGWTARSRFEAAIRQVESVVALVRADAMREGRALTLVAAERDGAWRLEVEEFGDEAAEEGADRRVVMELPSGVRVSAARPRPVEERLFAPAVEADAAPVEPERVDVCVLLPDGSAWGEVKYVIGPGERLGEMRVSAWTGAARVTEVPWPVATDQAADEETPPAADGA